MMLSGVSSSSEEQLWKLLFSSAAVFMHIIPTPSIGAIAAAACGKSRCAAAGSRLGSRPSYTRLPGAAART